MPNGRLNILGQQLFLRLFRQLLNVLEASVQSKVIEEILYKDMTLMNRLL